MGIDNSADIFQQQMNYLFHGFKFIRSYIDDLFVLTKCKWIDHVKKMELTLNIPKAKGIKFNTEK